jgi:UDP-N-acetylmuramoyl-L-alanyl-D-glutamate--2,6-diaminopimelate ligase
VVSLGTLPDVPAQPEGASTTATRPSTPPETPLSALAARLADLVAPAEVRRAGAPGDPTVRGLTLSSARVAAGDLYAALPGARAHGVDYASDAVSRGAVAVLTDPAGADRADLPDVPVLVVDDPRAVLGRLSAVVYGQPATALRLVAVTGTQGKTTTTRLAEAALEAAGVTAAVVGTVGTRIAGQDVVTSLTTPEAPDLHALFAVMRERQVECCAMEVSSHALVKGRVDGVVFDVAVFTNLGRDHLDFHRDLDDYFRAKAGLFTPGRARRGLVNVDDEHGRRLLAEASIPLRTFSPSGADADWRAVDVELLPTGSRFTVVTPDGDRIPTEVALPGAFNVANALAAVAGCGEAGIDPRTVAAGLATAGGVPGRLERVEAGQDFLAVVDYAHKPDAVTAALQTLRPVTAGRLLVVIGAGGERDPGKRPEMGEIAARLADLVVVTDDNPRGEDPAAIRAAVLAGADRVPAAERAELHEVGDRRAAIRLAVGLASGGDTVVVAGKGHETGQEVAGTVHPFDDRTVLREELAAR